MKRGTVHASLVASDGFCQNNKEGNRRQAVPSLLLFGLIAVLLLLQLIAAIAVIVVYSFVASLFVLFAFAAIVGGAFCSYLFCSYCSLPLFAAICSYPRPKAVCAPVAHLQLRPPEACG
ncbi:MAG: hypothetical protein IPK50_17715 [Fibrobacterota bacterium]|nr:MAG: hypothetical protein IPK50_17715 [Fibrobacterota bacterium]